MGIFSRVEGFLERLFEAPAGRLGARLQPVSLAKRIERAMDTTKSFGDEGVIVPEPTTTLHLNPTDYATFESYRSALEDDLAHGVLTRARREHYTLVGPAACPPRGRPNVPRGDVRWPPTWSTRGATGRARTADAGLHRHDGLRAARSTARPSPRGAPTCW